MASKTQVCFPGVKGLTGNGCWSENAEDSKWTRWKDEEIKATECEKINVFNWAGGDKRDGKMLRSLWKHAWIRSRKETIRQSIVQSMRKKPQNKQFTLLFKSTSCC